MGLREEGMAEIEAAFAGRFNAFVNYLDETGGDAEYKAEIEKRGRASRLTGMNSRLRELEARIERYQKKLMDEEDLDKRGKLENRISVARAEFYELSDEIWSQMGGPSSI